MNHGDDDTDEEKKGMFQKVWQVTEGPREKRNAPHRLTTSSRTQLWRAWAIVVQQVSTLYWGFLSSFIYACPTSPSQIFHFHPAWLSVCPRYRSLASLRIGVALQLPLPSRDWDPTFPLSRNRKSSCLPHFVSHHSFVLHKSLCRS